MVGEIVKEIKSMLKDNGFNYNKAMFCIRCLEFSLFHRSEERHQLEIYKNSH